MKRIEVCELCYKKMFYFQLIIDNNLSKGEGMVYLEENRED